MGKEILDPTMQLLTGVMFVLCFASIALLVLCQRCIDKEKLKVEADRESSLFLLYVPNRILSEKGKKIRFWGYVLLGIGFLGLCFIYNMTPPPLQEG
ncbi:hypothetical protein MLD52_12820 [Puniceicoccaceae bacterium K14]|nr:hypothetical protein [Puniceicoccaceae bacterium K14]